MSSKQTLHLYLDIDALCRIRAGQHNFFKRLIRAVRAKGWRVALHETSPVERLRAPSRNGRALFRMEEPTHDGALICRRTYIGPFWHIESSNTRWEWPVAKATFPAAEVDRTQADTFVTQWRKRLYPAVNGVPMGEGFVFVPLQGRLTEQRSFQSLSPVRMLEETLARMPARQIMATLHPNETYTPDELAALEALKARHTNLTLQRGGSEALLQACDLVVTQNSSLAFLGYFFAKPALLFAQIDFHHIAASVPHLGLDEAFYRVTRLRADYNGYLYWFLQDQAINAGRPECEEKIITSMRRGGWPI
ncbi:hypothetical protein [Phaeovulum sp.]|uniref:hypothetical protein n=1 Tax=Phaeovulum sp. TaxID=2934796 RepID=UPI0039E64CD8